MEWTSFLGAFLGGIIGSLLLFGGFLVWDQYDRRRTQSRCLSLDDILESHLEEYIVKHFDLLFPGWQVYDTTASNTDSRTVGIRYRTEAGEIDILCINSEGQFVVVELKRGRASDRVAAQVDRYIAWVSRNLAQAGQQVCGLVISKSVDKRLAYTLSRRPNVDFWTYDWALEFNKNTFEEILQPKAPKDEVEDKNPDTDRVEAG